jgi:hypothetical protein
MIEGFTSTPLDTLIGQAGIMNDLELQSYLASLSPTDSANFVAGQINGAVSSVSANKRSMFLDNSDKLYGADKNVEAAMYYLTRTKDLQNLATDADNVTSTQLNILNVNSDLSVRQNEINEWSNLNKLDTLFFLQILFTGLCFIAFILFLKVSQIVTHTVFLMLTVVTGIFIVLTLILRYRFTAISRDSRYWHKSRFPGQADNVKARSSSGSCPS